MNLTGIVLEIQNNYKPLVCTLEKDSISNNDKNKLNF
jgi:hypothetical protein